MANEALAPFAPETRLSGFLARDDAAPWSRASCRRATVAVASPMWRATEWCGFWVEAADGQVFYAKLLDEDLTGRIDVARTAAASKRAGEAGIAPRLLACDPSGGVLLFEALREGWRWGRLNDIDTSEGMAAAIALRARLQAGVPLGWTRDPFAETAALAEEALAIGAVLPADLPWMLRLVLDAGKAVAAAGIDRRPCHGDGIASNHMIGENGTLRLVDFDSAGDMDPFFDLATLLVETCPLDEDFETGLEMASGACRKADLSRVRLYAATEDLLRALFATVLARISCRSDVEFFKYAQWRFLRARMGFGDSRFEYWLRTL